VRLRRRYVPLIVALGIVSALLPAIASSETSPTVEAVNSSLYSHSWSPAQVSVGAGGVVTFSNSSEVPHGIEWRSALKPTCEEGAGKVPVGTSAAASATKWSGTCTFSQPGTYTFYCTVHGPEMTGTITVNPDGTTTTTMTTNPAPLPPTGAAPPPQAETPSGPPLTGAPSLRAVQHGPSVHGSLDVSQAGVGDRLEVDLFASSAALRKTKHATPIRVGRLLRDSLAAGPLAFTVSLDATAKRALASHRRLALNVKLTLTPREGKATTFTRSVLNMEKGRQG
jgi:plastocyanin